MDSPKLLGEIGCMRVVIPQHHAHVSVPCYLRQFVRLQEISQSGSRLVPEVVEVQSFQTCTLTGAIESLSYRVGLEPKYPTVNATRQAAERTDSPRRQRHIA